ncbi:hypothetical protein [Nostoc sp. DedQUE04]|uniref:hypothetical protein n=1 Tax=Nostoc sp. DedQUE04 TaxID=3075390 RepID=UPI002AD4BA75|nr:hypothetical protein [Nostoc sp. DedQUE04]
MPSLQDALRVRRAALTLSIRKKLVKKRFGRGRSLFKKLKLSTSYPHNRGNNLVRAIAQVFRLLYWILKCPSAQVCS